MLSVVFDKDIESAKTRFCLNNVLIFILFMQENFLFSLKLKTITYTYIQEAMCKINLNAF